MGPVTDGADQDPIDRLLDQLGAIAITVDRLDRLRQRYAEDLASQDIRMRAMENTQLTILAKLAAAKGGDAEEAAKKPRLAPEWMTIAAPDQAAEVLDGLARWVDDVWIQYGPIRSCWPWHPPVVAELLACLRAWQSAYHIRAPQTAPADWHARWRLAAAKQVEQALRHCSDPVGHQHGDDFYDTEQTSQAYAAYAMWWATSHEPDVTLEPGAVPPGLTLKHGGSQ